MSPKKFLAIIAVPFFISGCDPVSVTLMGVGAAASVSYKMDGTAYRTFTAPMPKVRQATLLALTRMGIKFKSIGKTDTGEVVKATTADRNIDIELEAVTPNITRVSSVARRGLMLVDRATASEIISQTANALGKSNQARRDAPTVLETRGNSS